MRGEFSEALSLLRQQLDWGVDEALDALPRDRLTAVESVAMPAGLVPVGAMPVGAMPAGAMPVAPMLVAGAAVGKAVALAGAARTLEDLRAALAAFSECPLQATAMQLVFGEGNPAASVMLVGETPGEAEDRSGRAFSGPGGQLLDKMLESIGLDRAVVRLATVIPWRPPGNRKPTEHERALCLPFLHRHIALVRPRFLLLLGSLAAGSLLGISGAGLRRVRGRWQEVAIQGLDVPVQALASCNPDQLLAAPAGKREAWADLLALRRALDAGGIE